jgi:hypothetical protein
MNFSRIRGFLLQQPKPARVMISSSDEDPTELKMGGSYAKLAKTIEAKNVDLIECFDANGIMLRALRLTSVEAQRSDAADIPKGIEADPQALMLTHFANLLHRAYEHSTEVAFARMVEVTAIMSERSESIEMRLERTEAQNRRLQQDQIESLYEQAEAEAERKAAESENGGLVDKLAGAFFSGQTAGAPANGAGKVNGAARKGAS